MRVSNKVVAATSSWLTPKRVVCGAPFNVAFFVSNSTPRRQRSSTTKILKPQWTRYSLEGASASAESRSSTEISVPTRERKLHTAYIALGSNLGDRVHWIEKACNLMTELGVYVKRTSCLWETKPMYVTDQENFLNGVCEVETLLEPLELLNSLQQVESTLKRQKVIDKGPRNIDLDILLYDQEVVDHDRLKVPHLLMLEREFVLRPLAELIPEKPINPSSPWKVTVDYLNALPRSPTPISTITPLKKNVPPLRALRSDRQTHVMAILNLTPDSFSDGGKYFKIPASNTNSSTRMPNIEGNVSSYVDDFLINGASIVDIGGQSSAPGTPDISADEEISRIRATISELHKNKRFENTVISVDTYRAAVAESAVLAGADIINDVSGGTLDPEMLPLMARIGKTVCLMHMRGTPATMKSLTSYPDGLIQTVASELQSQVRAAEAAGIRRWRIILDPGIGFAKSADQNLEILRRFDELRAWPGLEGLPWMVGSSRKAFIGKFTDVKTPDQRIWGTAATVAAAIQGGADIVRVHDVSEMAKVAKMSDAIWRV